LPGHFSVRAFAQVLLGLLPLPSSVFSPRLLFLSTPSGLGAGDFSLPNSFRPTPSINWWRDFSSYVSIDPYFTSLQTWPLAQRSGLSLLFINTQTFLEIPNATALLVMAYDVASFRFLRLDEPSFSFSSFVVFLPCDVARVPTFRVLSFPDFNVKAGGSVLRQFFIRC